MSQQQVDDSQRLVIPRWRPFRLAAALGELDAAEAVRPSQDLSPAPGEIEELVQKWKQNKTPFHAASLVDAALIIGKFPPAIEAAEWLLRNGGVSDVSLELARNLLYPPPIITSDDPPSHSTIERSKRIANYRQQLRRFPNDPLRWVDAAREYSIIGQNRPARKAILTAVSLAPNNRFVLRSAVRFFLHADDPDQAHQLLLKSSSTLRDPWLLSAEIVAAEARQIRSRHVRKGLELLSSENFHPRHLSELASAIGTLEHWHGRRRKVRKLFDQALEDPTENSVAQAAWIGRHMPAFELPESVLDVPRAYEARAWKAVHAEDYQSAIALSQDWYRDEPYSTRPALFGSWIAAVGLGDYRRAKEFVENARIANPDNPHILAQLLYCEASLGDTDSAASLLAQLESLMKKNPGDNSDIEWQVVLNADRGLISFRRGDAEQGRSYYQQAIRTATANHLQQLAVSASANLAREELRLNPTADVNYTSLIRDAESFPVPLRGVFEAFVNRIPRYASGSDA